jgi:hypothetical protein
MSGASRVVARRLGGLAGRDERGVVRGLDVADARNDDEEHDEDLERDERHVDPHRLLDADRDEHRQDGDEQEGRQVEVRAVGDRLRDRDAEPLEENPEIGRPPLRDHRGAEHELEQQVPADDPRDDLAEEA